MDLLSDDQLRFVPREGLRSLGQVAVHIANAEEGWVRNAITAEWDHWSELQFADYPMRLASPQIR